MIRENRFLDNVPNEPKLNELQSKGTRILAGRLASRYYSLMFSLSQVAEEWGAIPVILPTIEPSQIYIDKAGKEVLGQMYTFKDRGDRDLCLRPEATATCQILGNTTWKTFPNLQLWYWQRCYRYERPQAGRYREFTQFGIEVLNPTKDWTDELISLGVLLMNSVGQVEGQDFVVSRGVQRGLGLYNDAGFEFVCERLGAQKQVLGGGPYDKGCGFAIGIDRFLLMTEKPSQV